MTIHSVLVYEFRTQLALHYLSGMNKQVSFIKVFKGIVFATNVTNKFLSTCHKLLEQFTILLGNRVWRGD